MPDPTYHLSDHDLSVALHAVGEPSVGGVPSLPQARSLVETVSLAAAADLEELLAQVQEGGLRLVADRPEAFVFADPAGEVIADLLTQRDKHTTLNEAIIRSVMEHVASDLVSKDWSDADPIVVWKPTDWQRGETGVEQLLRWLLTVGLTPAQAIDFWATALRGIPQSEWASIRDTDAEAVTKNVTAARERLSPE